MKNMKKIHNLNYKIMVAFILATTIINSSAQTVYKCQTLEGITTFQQRPCTITGDGEIIKLQILKPSGPGGLRPEETAYIENIDKVNAERAKAEKEEEERQEELAVGRANVRASHAIADAERESAQAQRDLAMEQRRTTDAINRQSNAISANTNRSNSSSSNSSNNRSNSSSSSSNRSSGSHIRSSKR